MKNVLEIKNDSLFIRPNGELDHHQSVEIREQIDRAVFKGDIKKIIFDFNHVSFMDSSGIGLIMGRYKLMQAVGGTVCAFGVGKQMDKLITMSGIKKIVKIFDSEDDVKLYKGGEQ